MTSAPGPSLADRIAAPFQRFLAIEAASTILLLLAALAALAWANSPWGAGYARLWHTPLALTLGNAVLSLPLEQWVNDGLMAIFFLLVGMEIKHEILHGELASRERAMLPILGALGGMLAPAAIYAALHAGGSAAAGWGVPVATDIAFAIAALAVFGPRVPPGLKVFLLALAIVDDLGAVAVIAVFYADSISLGALAWAGAGLALVAGLRGAGVRSAGVYAAAGIGVWLAMLHSGVHATVAGVLLGLLVPHEHATSSLHPWTAFVVLPVFALANAGVEIEAGALADPLARRVALGVALGLLLGKPVGVTLVCWLGVRSGVAALPRGVGWGSIAGAGILAGIGFTMALFITALAFEDPALAAASKLGVMGASLVAACLGVAVLARSLPRP